MSEHAPVRGHQVVAAAHLAGLARQGLAEARHRGQPASGAVTLGGGLYVAGTQTGSELSLVRLSGVWAGCLMWAWDRAERQPRGLRVSVGCVTFPPCRTRSRAEPVPVQNPFPDTFIGTNDAGEARRLRRRRGRFRPQMSRLLGVRSTALRRPGREGPCPVRLCTPMPRKEAEGEVPDLVRTAIACAGSIAGRPTSAGSAARSDPDTIREAALSGNRPLAGRQLVAHDCLPSGTESRALPLQETRGNGPMVHGKCEPDAGS